MGKTNLIILFVILMLTVSCGNVSVAQGTQDALMLDSAKSLYDDGEYVQAEAIYRSFSDSGVVSEALYYNLGNCYFKMGDKAQSILYYEKALTINPGNEDAAHNLSVVNGTLIDKFEKLPSFSFKPLFKEVDAVISYDLIGVFSVLCLLVGVVLFYRMKKKEKKITFSNSWVVLLIALCLYLWGTVQKHQVCSASAGIVSINGVEVRSEPNEDAMLLFELNEGTKIEFIEESENWLNIKTQDGNQGWLEKILILEI
jgi:tetratricopeptide (TPR) repeat protein